MLQNKRVRFGLGQLGKGVVHVAVVALVGKDALQRVDPLGVLGELPVVDGDVWGRQVLPAGVKLCAGALGLLDDGRVRVAS